MGDAPNRTSVYRSGATIHRPTAHRPVTAPLGRAANDTSGIAFSAPNSPGVERP